MCTLRVQNQYGCQFLLIQLFHTTVSFFWIKRISYVKMGYQTMWILDSSGMAFDAVLQVSKTRKQIVKPSTKWTNEFDFTTIIPQVDLFSFVFWKKLKTPKRHFEINFNWPLVFTRKLDFLFKSSSAYCELTPATAW